MKEKLALTDTGAIDTNTITHVPTNLRCRAECPRHIQCHSPLLRHKDTEIVHFMFIKSILESKSIITPEVPGLRYILTR